MSNEIVNLGFQEQTNQNVVSLESQSEARAVAEVQAAYVIAKKFPRNQQQAYSNIITACKRNSLAEQSMYAYPRGGALVTGPSIRLAEILAQNWGNMDVGVREISRGSDSSTAEAYAIDLETNTRCTKVFHVDHYRDTKKGRFKLTDSRDIYELIANNGSRRMRACILAVLPGDVVEDAVAQCKKTMENSSDEPILERARKMVLKFDELGVKVEHIEKRLGHKLDAIIPAELVTLAGIYKSIKDGMSDRKDFFDFGETKEQESALANIKGLLKDRVMSDNTASKSKTQTNQNASSKHTDAESVDIS